MKFLKSYRRSVFLLTLGPMACAVAMVVGVVALLAIWSRTHDDWRPEFREGVYVSVKNLWRLGPELLSLTAPIDIGYAETGEACHQASGALLLRSNKVRQVLVTVDHPVCGTPVSDEILRFVSPGALPRRARTDTTAFWLQLAKGDEDVVPNGQTPDSIRSHKLQSTVNVAAGRPWPKGFMINCDRDRQEYSLRTLFADPGFGGQFYGTLASAWFRRGECLDPNHWPTLEAMIDLIWSLETYKSQRRKTRQ